MKASTLAVCALLLALGGSAALAQAAGGALFSSAWLGKPSRLSNGETLNLCLSGQLPKELKPRRLSVPKKGRLLLGFGERDLASMRPVDVIALKNALTGCLYSLVDPKTAARLGDGAVADATLRALVQIVQGEVADASEYVLDKDALRPLKKE